MLHLRLTARSLRDLDGIYPLAVALSHHFPQPAEMLTGIHELLMNAVEHGNLGLGFDAKTELLKRGGWHAEISRRLSLPEYAGRVVEVMLREEGGITSLTIADDGAGFAWREFVAREQCHDRPNGRGLHIAFHAPFDHIAFNEAGNCVTARVGLCASMGSILANSQAFAAF